MFPIQICAKKPIKQQQQKQFYPNLNIKKKKKFIMYTRKQNNNFEKTI